MMKDDFNSLNRMLDCQRISNVVQYEAGPRGYILTRTRYEIVQDYDLMAICKEQIGDVTPDEPRTAGYENFHGSRGAQSNTPLATDSFPSIRYMP
jgi:hypothetical protein